MKVIFGKRLSLGSLAIRIFTWSKWSHCAAILEDGSIVEATVKDGVVVSTMESFKEKYPDHVILDLPAYKGWQKRMLKHVGKKYDWSGILGFVFREDWESPSKWFCSELCAVGSGYFNKDYVGRITPQHLAMIGKKT